MRNSETYFSTYLNVPAPETLPSDYIVDEDEFVNSIIDNPQNSSIDPDLTSDSRLYYPETGYDFSPLQEVKQDFKDTSSFRPGKDFKSTVLNYFIDKGLTEAQARGIYGNLMAESGGRLTALSKDGHNSYGIALWTGPRKTNLFKLYGNLPTLKNQLDYLWYELNTSEKRALAHLKKTTSVHDATVSFMKMFERPNIKYARLKIRLKYAHS